MTAYRRARSPGATWFFTVNLAERHDNGLLIEHIDVLRTAIAAVMSRHPLRIEAMVVLPEHLHCIWSLPDGDSDYATRWGLIKGGFSRNLPSTESRSTSRLKRGERGIWQRRFWEHMIRDDADFARHVEYIHYNPVKHGWAKAPIEWPHSSFHRFVARGVYPADWGASFDGKELVTGER